MEKTRKHMQQRLRYLPSLLLLLLLRTAGSFLGTLCVCVLLFVLRSKAKDYTITHYCQLEF